MKYFVILLFPVSLFSFLNPENEVATGPALAQHEANNQSVQANGSLAYNHNNLRHSSPCPDIPGAKFSNTPSTCVTYFP